jgi:hypothetical protein
VLDTVPIVILPVGRILAPTVIVLFPATYTKLAVPSLSPLELNWNDPSGPFGNAPTKS